MSNPVLLLKDAGRGETPKRCVSYLLVNEGDPRPYLARETDLLPSDKPPVEIGGVRRGTA